MGKIWPKRGEFPYNIEQEGNRVALERSPKW